MREYLECMRAMFATFQQSEPSFYEGDHYKFSLMNPFFNPGPIDYEPPEILIAAVNPYMARLSGELCDGLRLHPIATFDFTRKCVIPAVEEGAEKSGRPISDIEVVGAPFLCLAKDEQGRIDGKQDGIVGALENRESHLLKARWWRSAIQNRTKSCPRQPDSP